SATSAASASADIQNGYAASSSPTVGSGAAGAAPSTGGAAPATGVTAAGAPAGSAAPSGAGPCGTPPPPTGKCRASAKAVTIAATVPQIDANSVVGRMPAGSLEPADARSAITA